MFSAVKRLPARMVAKLPAGVTASRVHLGALSVFAVNLFSVLSVMNSCPSVQPRASGSGFQHYAEASLPALHPREGLGGLFQRILLDQSSNPG